MSLQRSHGSGVKRAIVKPNPDQGRTVRRVDLRGYADTGQHTKHHRRLCTAHQKHGMGALRRTAGLADYDGDCGGARIWSAVASTTKQRAGNKPTGWRALM